MKIVNFELTDRLNGTIYGKIDIETVDDDEPRYIAKFVPDLECGHCPNFDWDVISQYLWDFQDESIIRNVEGLILKINPDMGA